MAAQLSFNFNIELPAVKKRVRYLVPTYIKFYTVYQYDRLKFTALLKEWLKTDEGKNRTLKTLKQKQEEILEKCWILDDKGNRLRDSDENHIYRIKTLHKIYEQIYNQLNINVFEQFERKDLNGLIVWGEEKQAEIQNTCYLPLKDKVTLHIELLRNLRKGFSIEESLERIEQCKKK